MLICLRDLKSLSSIERTQTRIMSVIFNGNSCITIFIWYSPSNVSDESDITTFFDELSSHAWYVPKNNVLIICGNMCCGREGPKRNNTKRGKFYCSIYLRKYRLTVTDKWLDSRDSFIESVTIYCAREDPCSDVIYHHNNMNPQIGKDENYKFDSHQTGMASIY